MEKQHTFKGKLTDHEDNNFVPGSVNDRIGMVLPSPDNSQSVHKSVKTIWRTAPQSDGT